MAVLRGQKERAEGLIAQGADVNAKLSQSMTMLHMAVINGDDEYALEITNRGNIDISGFEIKQYLGGNSEVLDVDESVLVGESIEWTFGGYNAASEKIEIFPVLNESSSAKTFTCYSDPEFIVI